MKKIFIIGAIACIITVLVVFTIQSTKNYTANGSVEPALTPSEQQHTGQNVEQPSPLSMPENIVYDIKCENFEQLKNDLAKTHAYMVAAEAELYDSLDQSEIDITGKNFIYQTAGFPVSNFRIQRVGFVPNNLSSFAFDARPEPVVPPANYQLTLALAKSDYADIIQMFETGDLTQHSTLDGWTILSTLMMHTELTPTILQQILTTGIKVTLTDLVFATLTKQNELVLDALAQSYSGDLNTTFQANGKTYNLTTLSVEMLNYPALKFWSNHDVGHEIKSDFYSSLDILPVPTNEHEQAKALAILDFLVKYGVQANDLHTLSRINQWSDHLYRDRLLLNDRFERMTQDNIFDEELIRYLEQMQQAQSYYYNLLDTMAAKQADCDTIDVAQYALFENSEHKNMQDWLSSRPKMAQLSDEDILGFTMALDTKKAVDAGDTESVVALLKQYGSLGGAHPEFDQVLFLSLLSHHASNEQLIKLAEYSPIPEQAIFLLIAQQRIEDIPKLIPYGLNVEATDPSGQTPVQFANQIGLGFEKVMQLSDALHLNTN